jgi:hypothetical protein
MNDYGTPCTCFARDAHEYEPVRYQWSGNMLWGIWAECPTHHENFMSPVWHPRLGQLHAEPAAADQAVPVDEVLSR